MEKQKKDENISNIELVENINDIYSLYIQHNPSQDIYMLFNKSTNNYELVFQDATWLCGEMGKRTFAVEIMLPYGGLNPIGSIYMVVDEYGNIVGNPYCYETDSYYNSGLLFTEKERKINSPFFYSMIKETTEAIAKIRHTQLIKIEERRNRCLNFVLSTAKKDQKE